MTESISWTNSTRKLSELIPWPINPAIIGKDEAKRLEESLAEFGQIQTIAVSPTNEIYDGHQRQTVWGASRKFGMDYEVDVRVSSRELTEQERKKLVIYLRKGTVGEFDFDLLANNFEFGDLIDWGFNEKELLGLDFGDEKPEDPGAQIDKAEELREKWGVKLGQLWQLGEHRLICGDCTDKAVVERVMGGEKADMGFFDPPYGISFRSNGRTATPRFDKLYGDDEINGDWIPSAVGYLVDAGAVYICTRWDVYAEWSEIIAEHIQIKNLIVWDKVDWSSGDLEGDYSPRHEFILFCVKGKHKLRGHRDSNIWAFGAQNKQDYKHPTQKKVEVPEFSISKSSNLGDIVMDWFLGSGTTLIACERLGRKCRAVEISPAYCTVAIQRWVDMTGGEPILLESDHAPDPTQPEA
jgi:DNA modification methylase